MQGVVQHSTINNLSFGRNPDETLRVLQALQYVQENPDEVGVFLELLYRTSEQDMHATHSPELEETTLGTHIIGVELIVEWSRLTRQTSDIKHISLSEDCRHNRGLKSKKLMLLL